jgi:hypothetical protein
VNPVTGFVHGWVTCEMALGTMEQFHRFFPSPPSTTNLQRQEHLGEINVVEPTNGIEKEEERKTMGEVIFRVIRACGLQTAIHKSQLDKAHRSSIVHSVRIEWTWRNSVSGRNEPITTSMVALAGNTPYCPRFHATQRLEVDANNFLLHGECHGRVFVNVQNLTADDVVNMQELDVGTVLLWPSTRDLKRRTWIPIHTVDTVDAVVGFVEVHMLIGPDLLSEKLRFDTNIHRDLPCVLRLSLFGARRRCLNGVGNQWLADVPVRCLWKVCDGHEDETWTDHEGWRPLARNQTDSIAVPSIQRLLNRANRVEVQVALDNNTTSSNVDAANTASNGYKYFGTVFISWVACLQEWMDRSHLGTFSPEAGLRGTFTVINPNSPTVDLLALDIGVAIVSSPEIKTTSNEEEAGKKTTVDVIPLEITIERALHLDTPYHMKHTDLREMGGDKDDPLGLYVQCQWPSDGSSMIELRTPTCSYSYPVWCYTKEVSYFPLLPAEPWDAVFQFRVYQENKWVASHESSNRAATEHTADSNVLLGTASVAFAPIAYGLIIDGWYDIVSSLGEVVGQMKLRCRPISAKHGIYPHNSIIPRTNVPKPASKKPIPERSIDPCATKKGPEEVGNHDTFSLDTRHRGESERDILRNSLRRSMKALSQLNQSLYDRVRDDVEKGCLSSPDDDVEQIDRGSETDRFKFDMTSCDEKDGPLTLEDLNAEAVKVELEADEITAPSIGAENANTDKQKLMLSTPLQPSTRSPVIQDVNIYSIQTNVDQLYAMDGFEVFTASTYRSQQVYNMPNMRYSCV